MISYENNFKTYIYAMGHIKGSPHSNFTLNEPNWSSMWQLHKWFNIPNFLKPHR
jgi:hypothetical protein